MPRPLFVFGTLSLALLFGCARSEPQRHTVLKPVADEAAVEEAHDHGNSSHDHHELYKDLPLDFSLPPEGEPVFVDVLEPGWKKIVDREIGKLSAEDQQLARHQRFCPVMDRHLGKMGVPHKLDLDGQPVFVCCECCEADLRKHAALMRQKLDRYYATRDQFTFESAEGNEPYFDDADLGPGWEKIIARDLGKLPEADRPLAQRQRFCPVMRNRLGKMGVPVKVQLESGPVFVCCQGCEKELREKEAALTAKLREYQQTSTKPAGE